MMYDEGSPMCYFDAPIHAFCISDMSDEERLSLKNQLIVELSHVRSTAERVKLRCPPSSTGGSTLAGTKRGPPKHEQRDVKKRKLQGSILRSCECLLKKLMKHQSGWVFNQPVDPVKLQIPDYFTIIKRPMDLGTVKSNLVKRLYTCEEDFAADVRLTFDNAILYNPHENDVHQMANELSYVFEMEWQLLKDEFGKGPVSVSEQQPVALKQQRDMKIGHKRKPLDGFVSACRGTITGADKQRLRKDLAKLSRGTIPSEVLAKSVKSEGTSRSTASSYNEGHKYVHQDEVCASRGGVSKATGQKQKTLMDANHGICHEKTSSVCSSHSDLVQSSSSDAYSEYQMDRGHVSNQAFHNGRQLDSLVNIRNAVSEQKGLFSDPDNDGAVISVLDEDRNLHTPNIVSIPSAEVDVNNILAELRCSPSKAVRAAMLKRRFADTIQKAKQKILASPGGKKLDPAGVQHEKEKLKKRAQEAEKAGIEDQVKAMIATQEAEAKKKRERDREAARLALEKMERTVVIDENESVMKDLELLGCLMSSGNEMSPGSSLEGFGPFTPSTSNPLEMLGLFVKSDDDKNLEYLEEATYPVRKAQTGDIEEGEIFA